MSRRYLLALVLILSPMAAAQDRSAGDERGRILALETAWNQAEQTKDIVALDQLLHSTLLYVDYDGTFMTKAEFLASIEAPDLHPT